MGADAERQDRTDATAGLDCRPSPGLRVLPARLGLPDICAALVLALLVVAFNPGLTLFGQVLGGYDAFVYFYPLRSYIMETLGRGQLPLWNPYLFAGSPYLANTQTAIFYPGTWLFALLDVPRAYALNFVGHVWLASVLFYAFARVTLGLGRVGSLLGGAAFAFSGFMNGQAGHINQFSVAALLPGVALALDVAMRTARPLPVLCLLLGLALQILAGHPQQVYMTVVALALLILWRALSVPGALSDWRATLGRLVRGGAVLGIAGALAAGIAAVQLIPTLELSRLSIRGGGLSYQLAAFDALPWPLLLPALFPGYWAHLPTTEFFGHLGTVVFVVAWLGLLGGRGRAALLGALYVALGLLLAVGDATSLFRFLFDWAPGFASFRVPARWLLVSTFGLAILAAAGLDWLVGWRHGAATGAATGGMSGGVAGGRAGILALWRQIGPVRGSFAGVLVPLALASLVQFGQPQSRWLLLAWGLLTAATLLIVALLVVAPRLRVVGLSLLVVGALADLWAAGMNLEYRHTVPDVAFRQPREAISELQARMHLDRAYRSLSIATPEYIVKETGEYEERYSSLPRLSLENLLVTVKWNDTLWPNTPLVHRVASADGYDGGVLPLRSYYSLTRAMLGSERARPDGVVASRLDVMPSAKWLDLFGVRWVVASRVKDETRGAVYYDRAMTVTLQPGQSWSLDGLPGGAFTTVGIVSSVATPPGTTGPAIGEQVAVLRLDRGDGNPATVPLVVGAGTAPETWAAEQAPTLDRVTAWSARAPDAPGDWIAELPFPSQPITRLEIVNTSADQVVQIRSLNLIDNGRQMAFPITLDSRVERLDFFDLKLYDRRAALSRAYLVPSARVLDDDAAAAQLSAEAFQPSQEVVLAPSATAAALTSPGSPGATLVPLPPVAFRHNDPERVTLTVTAPAESFLVLSDSWYPGWVATLNGAEVPIERANILFRAVRVPAGEHVVEFRFVPQSVRLGTYVSAASIVLTGLLLWAYDLWTRRRASGVARPVRPAVHPGDAA